MWVTTGVWSRPVLDPASIIVSDDLSLILSNGEQLKNRMESGEVLEFL